MGEDVDVAGTLSSIKSYTVNEVNESFEHLRVELEQMHIENDEMKVNFRKKLDEATALCEKKVFAKEKD